MTRQPAPAPDDAAALAAALDAWAEMLDLGVKHSVVSALLRRQAAALAALPAHPPAPPDHSCLGCGHAHPPSTWDEQSHAYLCVQCVHAIRWRPALEEVVDAGLEVNEDHTETARFAKALDPFRYCYPVPGSYKGPFADPVAPCAERTLAAPPPPDWWVTGAEDAIQSDPFDGRVERCIHGVSEREECEHCGFGWTPEPTEDGG